ncbi:MAG: hypothetical protein FJ125_02125 [Deltaproteobacteria bacterium]|nr:hypothetical protein [Deltaproteobacteria bacterium]
MRIVGMLRSAGEPEHRFFVFDEHGDRLWVGEHADQGALPSRPLQLSDNARRSLEERIRRAAAGTTLEEVHLGQYRCARCGGWEQACRDSWSCDICFDCSFDIASEMADRG